MRRRTLWLTLVSAVRVLFGPQDLAAAPGELSFQLMDQFGVPHRSSELGDRPLLIIGGGRAAGAHSREWAEAVTAWLDRYAAQDSVVIVRVADLTGVPRLLEGAVSKRLRGRHSTAILMDWDGVLSRAYDFVPRQANVLLLDSRGEVIVKLAAESPRAEQLKNLQAALEEVISSERTGERSMRDIHHLPADVSDCGGVRDSGGRERP